MEGQPWTRETVAARVREAWDTLRRVPAQRVPGFRTSWPDFVKDYYEAYGHSGVMLRLARAEPRAIDRMHEMFGWFLFLRDRPHLSKAMWLTCGAGMGPTRAGAILGVHRDTLRARRNEALDLIVEGLNRSETAAITLSK